MEFLLPEEAAPITSRGNCTPSPSPSLTTSPTHPLTKPREPPLPSSPSTLYLRHRLPHPLFTLYSRRRLTPWYRRGSIDALARSSRDDLSKIGKLTIVNRHPFLYRYKTCDSVLLNRKLSPSPFQPVYYQRCSIHNKRIIELYNYLLKNSSNENILKSNINCTMCKELLIRHNTAKNI